MSNAKKIDEFYGSKQGQIFRYFLQHEIHKIWDYSESEKIIGLGHSHYYEKIFSDCASYANMSPALCTNSVQINESNLPCRDAEINRVFAIHYLENTENAMKALQEIWRVLEPDGSFLLVVPNKKALWKDERILGKKSFTKIDVKLLLSMSKFSLCLQRDVVFYPSNLTSEFAKPLNFFGSLFLPFWGGVTIYHAQKLIFANRGRSQKVTPNLIDMLMPKKKLADARTMQQNKKL